LFLAVKSGANEVMALEKLNVPLVPDPEAGSRGGSPSVAQEKNHLGQLDLPSEESLEVLLAAFEAKNIVQAESLALELSIKFPKHELPWKILSIVWLRHGRLDEAFIAAQRVNKINSNDWPTQNILGLVHQKKGYLELAVECFQRAVDLNVYFAEAHNNLGNVYQEMGDFESAWDSYKNALSASPEYPEALYNSGNIAAHFGWPRKAIDFYSKAVELRPSYSAALNNLGTLLERIGDAGRAETCFREALSTNGRSENAIINLSHLLISNSRCSEALEILGSHEARAIKELRLSCLFELDDRPKFLEQLEGLIVSGRPSPALGSYTSRANLRYQVEKDNIFCEKPFDLIENVDLRAVCEFDDLFVAPCKSLLENDESPLREQQLLKNGVQTFGNIFETQSELVEELRRIIVSQIEKYRSKFSSCREGLITHWPKQYALDGWIVSMRSGGELLPHIHENGWISGSVYINVPQKNLVNEGNLVVCLDQAHLNTRGNVGEIIEVSTGLMCLFPSSLMHYTIPFESSSDNRVVLAFDVVPRH